MMKNFFIIISFLFMFGLCLPYESSAKQNFEKAIFAGGCFWCMESDFKKINGVKNVISGYIGGKGDNPTYTDYGKKGYIEAVQITYDSSIITYKKLLNLFWHSIDPTDANGQFCDRGHEYSSAIFYISEKQKKLAEQSKKAYEKSGQLKKPIATPIIKADKFYNAEDYHQNYYKKNPIRYNFYRYKCGRDSRLKEIWGDKIMEPKQFQNITKFKKPDKKELKKKLTSLQYNVTQKEGTEPPFKNEYWDNKKEGIYVGIVSKEPLFSSIDKYKSGTGWPSFTKPLEPDNIIERQDKGLFSVRTEIRSKHGDSHLGHVFNDGPKPTGLRYCMNSAALLFIPKKDLEKKGYGKYKNLFQKNE